jgi:hypothetical protein
MFAKRLVISSICLATLASGCGSGSPSLGTITGVAQPCVGGARTKAQIGAASVKVILSRESHAIADQVVTGLHIYKFKAPAGHYDVSTPGGGRPVGVVITSGEVTHASIPSICQ